MTDKDRRSGHNAELRKQAEAMLRKQGVPSSPPSPEELQETLHELRVHQIELEMQNEELRRAQVELEAARARYFDLYDLAPVGYCTLSEQGLILEANLTAATLLGMARGALVKQPLSRFIHKADQDIYYLHRKRLFETRSAGSGQAAEAQEWDLRLVRPDGALFWAHLTATAAQAEDGAPLCRVVFRDITERKRAEEKMRFFALAVESSSDAIGMSTPDGKHYYQNKVFDDLFGTIGENPPATLYVDEQVGREVFRTIMGGNPWIGEVKMRGKAGEVLDIFLSAYPIKDNAERILGLVGVHFNITDRKRAGAERENLEAQLRQSQKLEAVGRLAGGIAHDFNNLMTVVVGYSEIIRGEAKGDEKILGPIEEVYKAGVRATTLTRQLLAFSRKQVLKPEIFDLNKIVSDVNKMLQRLLGEDIDIIFRPDKDIGLVNADKGQIEQVIMNLAVNARDAMPTGGKLTMETKNVFLDDEYAAKHVSVVPGPHVLIAMTDTGCGMDEKTMSNLFVPFFTTKAVGKGTGLGLATVFGIVKQSGGHINVYSEPGRGTSFKIYLPCTDRKAGTGRPSQHILKPSKGNETILLVEDESSVRTLIIAMLVDSGYTILEAPNGNEALKICKEHKSRIHLLLSDVVMPGISGRELSNKITRLNPKMKVLFMSGYTDNAIQHHGVLDPGTAFIEKPFTQVSLTQKIREVLGAE